MKQIVLLKYFNQDFKRDRMNMSSKDYYNLVELFEGDDSFPKESSMTEVSQAENDIFSFISILAREKIEHSALMADGALPQDYFIMLSPYMRMKMKKFGEVARVFIVEDCLMSSRGHDSICFIMALNGNLTPTVLSLQIFNKNKISHHSALIAHLQFLRQQANFLPSQIFLPRYLHESIRKFNSLSQKQIRIHYTHSEAVHKMRENFTPRDIIKLKSHQKQALLHIDSLVEENDERKSRKILLKLKGIDRDANRRYLMLLENEKILFHQFSDAYVGFIFTRKYEYSLKKYVKKLTRVKYNNEHSLLEAMVNQEFYEKKPSRNSFVDRYGFLEDDKRLKSMLQIYEPKPFSEFIENYRRALKIKFNKASNFLYICGSKKGSPRAVEKTESLFSQRPTFDWSCECNYLQKTGIPCEHLIRVLLQENLKIDQKIKTIYKKQK